MTEASAAGWNRRAAALFARGAFASLTVFVVLATIAHATGPAPLAASLDLPFTILCHRLPERVIHVAGVATPLCSRCLGLWVGISLSAAIAWPVLPVKVLRVVLPVALALMLAEVVTQDLGLHPVFHPTRVLTGLLVGVPIGGAIGGFIQREVTAQEAAPSPAPRRSRA